MTRTTRCGSGFWGGLLWSVLLTSPLPAQPASPEETARIEQQLAALRGAIDRIPPESRAARWLPDVEVYAKAAEWIVRHQEFYQPRYVTHTLAALETGQQRADVLSGLAAKGSPAWLRGSGTVILGYRSAVDGSVQPYALTLPDGIDRPPADRWPLHVKLHGRGVTLNEVKFIADHDGKGLTEPQSWIQLDVFGRTNNAYRWAGETDVFEALADVQRRYPIDERRITLWGFSMGGAGAWHLGLHHPSRWSSVGAGAGFVDFYKYQKIDEPLPSYQDRALHLYNAVDVAENAWNVPVITYGGELDPQLAASLEMRRATEAGGVPLEVLIGPQMGHKFDEASFAKFMGFHAEKAAAGRATSPGRPDIRFVTYTPKYNTCEWLTVEELEEMYVPARAQSRRDDAGVLHVETSNIRALRVARGIATHLLLDRQGPFALNEAAGGTLPDVYFLRNSGGWELLDPDASREFARNPGPHKRRDLQGPIDDAFMQPFVCVRGTGTPWCPEQHAWAMWTLERFSREFDKWMRGRVPVIADHELTDSDLAGRNLILFGDPGSNSVLARVLEELPIRWTRASLSVAGEEYDPRTHGVALIYPNPLQPSRYVVVNSGHTIHDRQFRASNAWLFPQLGDVAVQRFRGDGAGGYVEEAVWAELFQTDWSLP
jgi:hypothetical protein